MHKQDPDAAEASSSQHPVSRSFMALTEPQMDSEQAQGNSPIPEAVAEG